MGTSMGRDESRRYTTALWHAVHERDLTFQLADEFADWWVRVGRLIHRDDIAAGFEQWRKEQQE
jgi:hypothetical protein